MRHYPYHVLYYPVVQLFLTASLLSGSGGGGEVASCCASRDLVALVFVVAVDKLA